MMTPVFGFRDPLLHDAKSPYFLGRWYPEGAPDVFLKQTVLPARYKDIYFDEKHRLPLYQAAFHDAIVTTHQWSAPSLKFKNVLGVNELLELIYGVPPLYHLDLGAWQQHKDEILRHYRFFSRNYRELALLPLSEFALLTPDHEVQETRFGDVAAVVANFGAKPYAYPEHAVPPNSVLLIWKKTGKALVYTSQYAR
jgi:Glycosyl hydrolases related to GH101 family, GH129